MIRNIYLVSLSFFISLCLLCSCLSYGFSTLGKVAAPIYGSSPLGIAAPAAVVGSASAVDALVPFFAVFTLTGVGVAAVGVKHYLKIRAEKEKEKVRQDEEQLRYQIKLKNEVQAANDRVADLVKKESKSKADLSKMFEDVQKETNKISQIAYDNRVSRERERNLYIKNRNEALLAGQGAKMRKMEGQIEKLKKIKVAPVQAAPPPVKISPVVVAQPVSPQVQTVSNQHVSPGVDDRDEVDAPVAVQDDKKKSRFGGRDRSFDSPRQAQKSREPNKLKEPNKSQEPQESKTGNEGLKLVVQAINEGNKANAHQINALAKSFSESKKDPNEEQQKTLAEQKSAIEGVADANRMFADGHGRDLIADLELGVTNSVIAYNGANAAQRNAPSYANLGAKNDALASVSSAKNRLIRGKARVKEFNRLPDKFKKNPMSFQDDNMLLYTSWLLSKGYRSEKRHHDTRGLAYDPVEGKIHPIFKSKFF